MAPAVSKLTLTDVKRAIFVDYEGNVDRAPTLLGWRCDGVNHAAIVDPAFATCAERYRAKQVQVLDHARLAQRLVRQAEAENRLIISWSEHDRRILHEMLSTEDQSLLLARYRNAIKPARSWFWRTLGVTAPDGSLSFFCGITGFDVPERFGGGIVGQGLRLIRSQLEQGRAYADLTPKARASWVAIVRHNRLDLEGMERVLRAVVPGAD